MGLRGKLKSWGVVVQKVLLHEYGKKGGFFGVAFKPSGRSAAPHMEARRGEVREESDL